MRYSSLCAFSPLFPSRCFPCPALRSPLGIFFAEVDSFGPGEVDFLERFLGRFSGATPGSPQLNVVFCARILFVHKKSMILYF